MSRAAARPTIVRLSQAAQTAVESLPSFIDLDDEQLETPPSMAAGFFAVTVDVTGDRTPEDGVSADFGAFSGSARV